MKGFVKIFMDVTVPYAHTEEMFHLVKLLEAITLNVTSYTPEWLSTFIIIRKDELTYVF